MARVTSGSFAPVFPKLKDLLLDFSGSDARITLVSLREGGHRSASQPRFLYKHCRFFDTGAIRENALFTQTSSSFFARSFCLIYLQVTLLVSMKSTLLENMFDCLISLPTFAPTIFNPWHIAVQEKFRGANFYSSHLYHQRVKFFA